MMAVSRSREHFWSRLSWAEDWRLISREAEFRLGRWEFWKLCQRSFLQGKAGDGRAGDPGEGPFPARGPSAGGAVSSPGCSQTWCDRVPGRAQVTLCLASNESSQP